MQNKSINFRTNVQKKRFFAKQIFINIVAAPDFEPVKYTGVIFMFDLRRKPGYYILTQIMPTIVITLLTIIG